MDRRQFIERAAGTAGVVVASSHLAFPAESKSIPKPTDRVEIGKTGVKVPRIAMGTGTRGGRQSSNQVRLGQEGFTKIARRVLDSGLNFFESADAYGSMPYYRKALEGVPRDKIVYLSKLWGDDGEKAQKDLERFLKELGTDHIDIVLTHFARSADWAKRREGVLEVLSKAKEKGMIRACGLSLHGMAPLQTVADTKWGDFALIRINHNGERMDGKPDEVASHLAKIKKSGKSIMAMKVLGGGALADERDESLRFVLGLGTVDVMTIGFEKPEHVDDIVKRWESAAKDVTLKATA